MRLADIAVAAIDEDAALTPLGKHDRRFHPRGFNPESDTCSLRDAMAKGDESDALPDSKATSADEYAAVVARYTNPDGSKKQGWMCAPNGRPTHLTERQWVQVRTPSFKEWFGDWEAAELQQWLEGEPVASATGHEYENVARGDLEEAVVEFYKNRGVTSMNNGDVGRLTLRGVAFTTAFSKELDGRR